MPKKIARERWRFLIIAFVGAALLFWNLGGRGLNEPDEGRYASVVLRMLNTGDWIHPVFNGAPHLTKPLLTYWAMAAHFALFGANEWAARLHSALAALGILLLAADIARRWSGWKAAGDTIAILATAPLFFAMARLADPNMLLTFWIMLSIWAWIAWQQGGSRLYLWLFYAALGLGFFTKGPVTIALVAFGVWALRRFTIPTENRRRTWSWSGCALAAGIGLWWFVWMIAEKPELFRYFLGHEVVARVASPTLRRNEPFWFPLACLFGGLLPWSLFAFRWIYRKNRIAIPPHAYALAWWIGLELLMFTISRSKLATYVLPLLPPAAILIATTLHDGEGRTRIRIPILPIAAMMGALLLVLHDAVYPRLSQLEKLTAAPMLKTLRAVYSGEPIFFTSAPAATYFYLNPTHDVAHIPHEPGDDALPRAEQVATQLDRHMASSRARNELIIVHATPYREAIQAGRVWPELREIAGNRYYIALTRKRAAPPAETR